MQPLAAVVASLRKVPTPAVSPSPLSESADFWDSQLAAVVVTGLFAVIAAVMAVLLKPGIERLMRREQAEETERQRWRDHGRELVADLAYWIIEFSQHDDNDRIDRARAAWHGDLRRRTTMLSRFAPEQRVRKIALRVRVEMERAHATVQQMRLQGPDHPQHDASFERYNVALSEAHFILAKLTEALGGEKAPSREEWPDVLRHFDDGKDSEDFSP